MADGDSDQIRHSGNIPADIPTHNKIVHSCYEAGFYRNGVAISVAGKPRFWVKYGDDCDIRGEGRTQAHVAAIVNANPARVFRVPEVYLGFSREGQGYIVMDFVHGTTIAERKTAPKTLYHKSDITAVAVAYKQLVDIKMPAGTAPGPVGGGRIGHDFFVESMSTLTYPAVGHLEAQINEVCFPLAFGPSRWPARGPVPNKILRHLCDLRVDFQTEIADGLVLCPSDLHDSNYMIDDEGGLWAVDFGRTCFLPPSFVSYSFITSSDIFVKYVAWYVDYPRSPNLRGMDIASGQMVIFGDNNLGTAYMRRAPGRAPARPPVDS